MEGLIILGLIIYGIYSLMGESCEHEWIPYNYEHVCSKCGKSEGHDYQNVTRDAWADENIDTYTVTECRVCGCNQAYDND